MIRTFKHKGLKELFEKGASQRIHRNQQSKCIQQLDAIDAAENPSDLNIPGWRLHKLQGYKNRYSLTITGNFRITFDFKENDAYILNYEDYH